MAASRLHSAIDWEIGARKVEGTDGGCQERRTMKPNSATCFYDTCAQGSWAWQLHCRLGFTQTFCPFRASEGQGSGFGSVVGVAKAQGSQCWQMLQMLMLMTTTMVLITRNEDLEIVVVVTAGLLRLVVAEVVRMVRQCRRCFCAIGQLIARALDL